MNLGGDGNGNNLVFRNGASGEDKPNDEDSDQGEGGNDCKTRLSRRGTNGREIHALGLLQGVRRHGRGTRVVAERDDGRGNGSVLSEVSKFKDHTGRGRRLASWFLAGRAVMSRRHTARVFHLVRSVVSIKKCW